MTVEEILHALDGHLDDFPREAFREAIRQQEEITPHLLDALRHVRDHHQELPESYWQHVGAMLLLAQFRETAACPLIVDLFSLPPNDVERLLGDFVSEDSHRVLASVCGNQTAELQRLAENPRADEFARDAALEALVTLVANGQFSREDALEYFRKLFHTAEAEPESFFWTGLVANAAELYPDSLLSEIRSAYDRDLVDPSFIDLEEIESTLAGNREAVLARLSASPRYRLVDDARPLAEEWYALAETWEPPASAGPLFQVGRPPAQPIRSGASSSFWKPQPPVSVGPKPGRNDPCPCGSGLKYKKCCLNSGKH